MAGGMDHSQFKDFVKNFKDFAKDYHSFLNDFLTEQGMECLANTKKNTPVDTGRLRNAWKLSGPFKKGDDRYVVIHNNVNYASFVEDGHRVRNNSGNISVPIVDSRGKKTGRKTVIRLGEEGKGVRWVKGHHMARIALTKQQIKMPAKFETEFKKFCKRKGIG